MKDIFLQIIADQNRTALIVGIIALSGVILSAFISASVSRRSNYINSVTAERSKWIEKLRHNLSECVGALGYLHYKTTVADEEFDITDEHHELVKNNEVLITVIQLQLNPSALIRYCGANATSPIKSGVPDMEHLDLTITADAPHFGDYPAIMAS